MKKLIQLELDRFTLRPHLIGLLVTNLIIMFLSVFISYFLFSESSGPMTAGIPLMQLDTISMASMLVRAALIVWESVLISSFIIEEYRSKTINLLFTYPVSRTRLIIAKLILICGIMLIFHIGSSIFQNFSIFLLNEQFEFVTYSFENLSTHIITTISTILLGLFPLFVGMVKKSTIATIVSSLLIIAIASNSQGSTAGLLTIPMLAVFFSIIGVIFSTVAIRKMITSDLYN
ncbi:ABC transporter permease [Paenibacillus lautus]|uniref:ABC transporter permease n=1 Tax=Paenibacillus lautus TaxID=1401 RepID=UPI003D2DD8FF